MLAGKEQALVDGGGERRARLFGARIAVGVRAERPWIARPCGLGDRRKALAHVVAEHGGDLLDRESRECAVAIALDRAGEFAAEIAVDHRPAERAQRVAAGLYRGGRAEQPYVDGQIFGPVELEKH